MTDTRTALKNQLNLDKKEEVVVSSSVEASKEEVASSTESKGENKKGSKPAAKAEDAPKKRRGRPTTSHRITKIHLILEKRGLTRRDLFNLIAKKYPDEPISPDAVSRIVSGKRKYYSTPTLFRICGALGVTPNQVLEYEDEIV